MGTRVWEANLYHAWHRGLLENSAMQEVLEAASFWERYQTGIVGIVGFAGVIITLVVNSRLAKREREAALDTEQGFMRVALAEELEIIKTALTEGQKHCDKALVDGQGLLVPIDAMSSAYESLLPRIGVFPREHVRKVMQAYLTHMEYRKNLALLPNAEFDGHRVYVQHGAVAHFKEMTENVLPIIDEAIDILSSPTD